MTAFKALPLLASQVDDILPGDVSYGADGRQIAAAQRKDLDITKTEEAQLSEELGNVVRVPPSGGTGVSQAPVLSVFRKDTERTSMQPPVALHRQPEQAVSASPSGDADEVRRHLMEAVRQARDVLKDSMPLQQSTAADYARKTKHLSKKVQALAKDWPRSGADQSTQIMQVALGEYAATPNSFFAKRRALQHWVQLRLEKALKDQDALQKSWPKTQDAPGRLALLEQMHQATIQLNGLYKQYLDAGAFERMVCLEAFSAYSTAQDVELASTKDAKALQTKALVALLNRRVPDWQEKFRAANEESTGRYRSHAVLQTLTGIRPTEFDPDKNQPSCSEAGGSGKGAAPGVVAMLGDDNRIRVRVPGGKVGPHSGQTERFFELESTELPSWFVQELADAGGSKTFLVKTQALRDHYDRVSRQAFKGLTYGKGKRPLHATPYCFRHDFATDLRNDDWSAHEIAAALGHLSDDTQGHYGFRKGGTRKPKADRQHAVVKGTVTTTNPVAPKKRSWDSVSGQIQNQKSKSTTKAKLG